MHVLYDTRTVRPHERYDYYRAGAGIELAPVAVHGRGTAAPIPAARNCGRSEVDGPSSRF
jgi:hypothetical protein